MVHLFRRHELGGDAHVELRARSLEPSGGDIDVLRRNQRQDLGDGQVVLGQAVGIELQANLPFEIAGHLDLQDTRRRFQHVLHVVGDLLEQHGRNIARQTDQHDRQLGEVDLFDDRLFRVLRQFPLRHVHTVAHPLQRDLAGHIRVEFDADQRHALGAAGGNLFNASNPVEFLFDLHRDGRLNVLGGDPLVHGRHHDIGNGNVRSRLARQRDIAGGAQQNDDQAQDGDSGPVSNRGIGEEHGVYFVSDWTLTFWPGATKRCPATISLSPGLNPLTIWIWSPWMTPS